MPQERLRGRPRDEATDLAILTAACDLLLDDGYERLTMERVATRAGVGKPTVYRRWSSKAHLVGDAVHRVYSEAAGRADQGPAHAAGVRRDLADWLQSCAEVAADRRTAPLVLALVAAAAGSRADAQSLYGALTRVQHEAVVRRLRAGAADGELRPDADFEAVADALIGSVLYQLLTDRTSGSSSRATALLDVVLNGLTEDHR
ncbi:MULTISPECIES: TetR/AcrR family transcriptional regulator [unclassified Streptomyces]|uniref:TetR/AcrR family transcriptional regulator n=1 Tax=unclassified Streptomyces TaxID=2593676 RepID=UPI0036E5F6C1